MKQSSVRGFFLTWALLAAGAMSIRLVPFRIWDVSVSRGSQNTALAFNKIATLAEEREYPYMIYMFYEVKQKWRGCSASLINSNWVLTAAHCFISQKYPPGRIFFVGGKNNLHEYILLRTLLKWNENVNEGDLGVEERRAKKIFIHPNFTLMEEKIIHDVALVQLQKPFTDWVKTIPICFDKIKEKKLCTILGWGRTLLGKTYGLQVVRKKEVSTMSIGCRYNNSYPLICLKHDGLSGICNGDSGSPLVCDGKVWGVASYMLTQSDNCGDSLEDYYTELSAEKDWIQSILNAGIRSVEINFSQVFVFAFASVWITRKIIS